MAKKIAMPDAFARFDEVKYLGSHPKVEGVFDSLKLGFFPDRVGMFTPKGKETVFVPAPDLRGLDVMDHDELESKVTFGRVLVLGAFALLAKKTRRSAFLEIRDPDGEWIFAVAGMSAVELESAMRPIRPRYGLPATGSGASGAGSASVPPPAGIAEDQGRVADRLRHLDGLRADGVISEMEHAEQRARILADL